MTATSTKSIPCGRATNLGLAHDFGADQAFGGTTGLSAVSFGRHAQALLYESFRHAQGDQQTQVHFMQAYGLLLRRAGIEIDFSLKNRLVDRIRSRLVPNGHMSIANPIQVRAQFEFWWLNMWDIFSAIYQADSRYLVTREQLDRRATAVGGTADMSSFTDEEMSTLDHAFTPYRHVDCSELLPSEIVGEYFLPNLIRVERNFQGRGGRYTARPRTDNGDVHQSKMLDHCAKALRHLRRGIAGPIDLIYVYVCGRLDWLSRNQPSNAVYVDYLSLIDSYNTNHSHAPAIALHAVLHRSPPEPVTISGSSPRSWERRHRRHATRSETGCSWACGSYRP